MIGRQRSAPGKGIGLSCLPRAEGHAGWGVSAPVVDRKREVNDAARSISRDMNSGRIGHNHGCSASLPLNG